MVKLLKAKGKPENPPVSEKRQPMLILFSNAFSLNGGITIIWNYQQDLLESQFLTTQG